MSQRIDGAFVAAIVLEQLKNVMKAVIVQLLRRLNYEVFRVWF